MITRYAIVLWFKHDSITRLLACGIGKKTALLALFEEEKELRCSLAAMKDSISMQWDQINLLLENNMPAEMPGEERANMLKVRNANLIRMFQILQQH